MLFFVRLVSGKVLDDGFTETWQETDLRQENDFKLIILKVLGCNQRLLQPAIFEWFSKQQVNLSVLVLNWYWQKGWLTDFSGNNRKLTSDMILILNSYESSLAASRNYYIHFWLIFQAKRNFAIAFVRLILGKVGVDRFTRKQRETEVRYQFGF